MGVDTDLDKLTAALEARDKSATRAFCDDLIARIYKAAEPYPLSFFRLPSLICGARHRIVIDCERAGPHTRAEWSRWRSPSTG